MLTPTAGAKSKDEPVPEPAAALVEAELSSLAAAQASGNRIEVVAARSETETVWANPDGESFTAEIAAVPVRVRRGDEWVPVSTDLVRRSDGSVGPEATPVELAFSGGGDDVLARVADGDAWVSFAWPGVLPEPSLDGPIATYANVLPGVDLVVQAGVEGFSEYLVVQTQAAAASPELTQLEFEVATSAGLSLVESDGGLTVHDAAGEPLFTGPPPRMWDSAGVVVGTRALDEDGDDFSAEPGSTDRFPLII